MTSRKPEGRPLSNLLLQFADLEAREWAALDAAGVTKPDGSRRGAPKTREGRLALVAALSCSGFEAPQRDPAIVVERIERLPSNERGWKKRKELWRHLKAAMSARDTIEAIMERDLSRAVENAYYAGVHHLRHLAEIGEKAKDSGRRPKGGAHIAEWLRLDRKLPAKMSVRARAHHIARLENVPFNTVWSALKRSRKKVGAQA